jgi:hypothetical protein
MNIFIATTPFTAILALKKAKSLFVKIADNNF